MKEYVSIAELSRLTKIPKAKLYRLLESEEYKKYLAADTAVKRVSIELLEVLNGKPQAANPPAPQETAETEKAATKEESEIERLRRENQELKELIRHKDSQIQEYTSKFAELAAQAQILAGQAQVLQLADRPPKVLPESSTEPHKPPKFFNRLFHR